MNDVTRVARRLDRELVSRSERTSLPRFRLRLDDRRQQYERLHGQLRSAVLEEPRPGLFVFVTDAQHGTIGRLWLAATDEVRAGTVGRHGAADLSLCIDDELSLRHALFVVRQREGLVRFTVVELETSNGLTGADGLPVHRLEADGPLGLRAGRHSFFCAPTGPGLALPDDEDQAWALFDAPPPSPARGFVHRLRQRTSAPRLALLSVAGPDGAREVPLSPEVLERGVLLGRNERCQVQLRDPNVSRVHAALLTVDGAPFAIDAGSLNGLRHLGQDVGCHALEEGDVLSLGDSFFKWSAAH